MGPQWLTAIGTVGAVIVALYLSIFREWQKRPVIKIIFDNRSPFCRESHGEIHDKDLDVEVPTGIGYWVRLKIRNVGRSVAKNCEGRLEEIWQVNEKGEIIEFQPFDPVVLHWVGEDPEGGNKRIDINRKSYQYLDVFQTFKGENLIFIEAASRLPRGIVYDLQRGKYIFKITIYGDNIEPETKKYSIEWVGDYKSIRMYEIRGE